jgi:hypothetical protein
MMHVATSIARSSLLSLWKNYNKRLVPIILNIPYVQGLRPQCLVASMPLVMGSEHYIHRESNTKRVLEISYKQTDKDVKWQAMATWAFVQWVNWSAGLGKNALEHDA